MYILFILYIKIDNQIGINGLNQLKGFLLMGICKQIENINIRRIITIYLFIIM